MLQSHIRANWIHPSPQGTVSSGSKSSYAELAGVRLQSAWTVGAGRSRLPVDDPCVVADPQTFLRIFHQSHKATAAERNFVNLPITLHLRIFDDPTKRPDLLIIGSLLADPDRSFTIFENGIDNTTVRV